MTTKISEHCLANALDICGFIVFSERTITVLGNWPYGAARRGRSAGVIGAEAQSTA